MGNDRRRIYWYLACGWTALIYSTLSVVRPICAALKEAIPFSLTVNVLFILLLAALVFRIFSVVSLKKKSSYFILGTVMLAYGYGLVALKFPEERIHFLEYGVLAFLLYKAIHADVRGAAAYFYALILTGALGWIDEGIQYHLPNRYYHINDVVLNIVSGALALLLVFIVQRERSHD